MSGPQAIGGLSNVPLTTGIVPRLVLAAGCAALLALAARRRRGWWTGRLPYAALLAGVLTGLLWAVVENWWQPFPEGLPHRVTLWLAVALLGLCVAGFRMPVLRPRYRPLAAAGAALVVLASASQINRCFDQYPTVRDLLSPSTQELITDRDPLTVSAPPGRSLAEIWRPPGGLPAHGTVSRVRIPGLRSGFHARHGYVYLPPAYRASPRPLLPVLVLLPGSPGAPEDWVNSGRLPQTMDAFAAEHGGLAPIVLVVDAGGSRWGNTLCLDSRLARTQTYLAQDVPAWAQQNLQTATGRTAWAIGGLSYGGTCALQLGVNAPEVYGAFLDISGQQEPTLGSHGQTVARAFGGDEAAFAAVDPVQVMARKRFPDTAAAFVVGGSDGEFGPQQQKVYAAASAAGMHATFTTLPGWHDWTVFRGALAGQLPWLTRQTGLIP